MEKKTGSKGNKWRSAFSWTRRKTTKARPRPLSGVRSKREVGGEGGVTGKLKNEAKQAKGVMKSQSELKSRTMKSRGHGQQNRAAAEKLCQGERTKAGSKDDLGGGSRGVAQRRGCAFLTQRGVSCLLPAPKTPEEERGGKNLIIRHKGATKSEKKRKCTRRRGNGQELGHKKGIDMEALDELGFQNAEKRTAPDRRRTCPHLSSSDAMGARRGVNGREGGRLGTRKV